MRFRNYDYFTFGTKNAYGQQVLSTEPVGTVKLSITTLSRSAADNIKYKDATYLGLTLGTIDDTYVISYGEQKLKVLYVIPDGRFKQVFLKEL